MMKARVIMICGKICSGKSTYAQKLRLKENAVILSCDEITLSLFDGDLGDKHDEIAGRTQKYFFEKSLEIIEIGTNVILEWGFWRKSDREYAKTFYAERNIPFEFHYVDVSDKVWEMNIEQRNKSVAEGKTAAYYVDDGLAAKFASIFEMPEKSEIDVWYVNERSN